MARHAGLGLPGAAVTGRRAAALTLVLAVWAAWPFARLAPLAAQDGQTAEVSASPTLPADHWAVAAARRAEAAGLAPGFLPAQTGVPRHVVAAALREAAAAASRQASPWQARTQAWLARFAEEFPESVVGAAPHGFRRLGGHGMLGVVEHEGAVQAGDGILPESRTGARPVDAPPAATARLGLAGGVGPHFSAYAEPAAASDGLRLRRGELRAGWRSAGLVIGRQPVGYGYAPGAGVVASGAEPIDAIQLESLRPVRLPGPAARLGEITFHAFASRLEEPRHPGAPYFWGIAGSYRPHPRFTLSVHRAAIMAGDSVPVPLTLGNFLRTFVGHNLLTFENEVVAVQLRYRLPTESVWPLTLYTEWGAEDGAGAWRDVPGRVYGVYSAALPGLPDLALGLEYAHFGGSCCGNPPWYRHIPHTGGWVVDHQPFGHPLGGQGRQARAYAELELLDTRLRVRGEGFRRHRVGENLFVPGREGGSTGVELRSALRLLGRTDAGVTLFYEDGAGWSEHRAALELRAFF